MTYPFKVAAITGASSGIGRALALALARKGCAVGLIARREAELIETRRQVEAAGGKACVAVADVARREQISAALQAVRDALGEVDLVVANAGMAIDQTPLTFEPEREAELMDVNYHGAIDTIYAALPPMIARKRGHVVGISSLAGYVGLPLNAAYCASKAALSTHLEALRLELRPIGVHVTSICPGFVRTPLIEKNTHPRPLIMDADAAARRILRAIERRRRVYNFPWLLARLVMVARSLPRAVYDLFMHVR